MKFVMFAKHLQEWPLEKAARVVKSLGFDGIDLTVRGGGYVLPENVERDLPEAPKVIAEAGLEVPMLTTNITDVTQDHSEAVIATAARCGVRELKYGYHTYKKFGEFKALCERARQEIGAAAKVAGEHGVRLNLHIHSNNFVTANAAVVAWLLQDIEPATAGAYIDPGHMTIEGGVDLWRQGLELLADRTNLMAVKSMGHFFEPDGSRAGRWTNRMVPLQRGMVDWVKVWQCLDQFGYDGVVSLHSEYQGGHSWRDLTIDEVVDQTREDFAYLKACRDKARSAV
ncbi:MAG: sugar phosphate isomerase/epimerase [Armatimonadetes bacterium]|nr:sugar phosphate isomerase/epimerase [Armatimonadota bacterium]